MSTPVEIQTYLAKHRIQALFTSLTAALAIHRPADVRGFLISELQKPRPGQLVTADEAAAVFDLFDLRRTGNLSTADAAKALAELDVVAAVDGPVARAQFIDLVTGSSSSN